mgnify:CR=1 FL=1
MRMLGQVTSPNTSREHTTRKLIVADVPPLYRLWDLEKFLAIPFPPIMKNMKHDLSSYLAHISYIFFHISWIASARGGGESRQAIFIIPSYFPRISSHFFIFRSYFFIFLVSKPKIGWEPMKNQKAKQDMKHTFLLSGLWRKLFYIHLFYQHSLGIS